MDKGTRQWPLRWHLTKESSSANCNQCCLEETHICDLAVCSHVCQRPPWICFSAQFGKSTKLGAYGWGGARASSAVSVVIYDMDLISHLHVNIEHLGCGNVWRNVCAVINSLPCSITKYVFAVLLFWVAKGWALTLTLMWLWVQSGFSSRTYKAIKEENNSNWSLARYSLTWKQMIASVEKILSEPDLENTFSMQQHFCSPPPLSLSLILCLFCCQQRDIQAKTSQLPQWDGRWMADLKTLTSFKAVLLLCWLPERAGHLIRFEFEKESWSRAKQFASMN